MRTWKIIFCLIISLSVISCSKPAPEEISQAELQALEIQRAGSRDFAAEEVSAYFSTLETLRLKFFKQKYRFVWFRSYDDLVTEYRDLLAQGAAILSRTESIKREMRAGYVSRISEASRAIGILKEYTFSIIEGASLRKKLLQADMMIAGVKAQMDGDHLQAAAAALDRIEFELKAAESSLLASLKRYTDPERINQWNKWAREGIAESKKSGGWAIVVSKMERSLLLYKGGREVRRFSISMGRDGLRDKRLAGDHATPEGKYRIIRKNPRSAFYKALVIDYPNADDRRLFARLKRSKEIPAGAGIGGLIEIHGGGSDSVTEGCIALENDDIDFLFERIEPGIPVIIIGTRISLLALLHNPDGKGSAGF